MLIFMKVQNLKTILFVSVIPQSANNAVTTNIGICLSQNAGIKTLVVDANMEKPTLQKLLKIDENQGFAHILEDTSLNLDKAAYSLNPSLQVLQAGTISENSARILNEAKIKPIIKKLRGNYGGVLLDCTMMKKVSDISMLSSSVDGVVLIINEGKDNIQVIRSVVHALKLNKANIIGGILNNRTFPIPSWLYKRI
jgi:Mrp family chromosome partitioning ATPase